MKPLILFFCICLVGAELSAQVTTKPSPQLKAVAIIDSVKTMSVSWTVDTVLIVGTKGCPHDFHTAFEGQQYPEVDDSLKQIYNPNNERIIQVVCLSCNRQEIRTEHIVIGKKPNLLRVILK